MHLGGEGESRGEKLTGVGEAEPKRVESSRGVRTASAHAPPTRTKSVCILLARSLARLTRASENAGEGRSPARRTYATSFTGVETRALIVPSNCELKR